MTQRTPRIDVHAHMMERQAAAAGVPHSVVTAFGARQMPPAAPGSAQEMAERAGFDPATHIEMLDRLGLDAEVVSNMTVMQGTSWAEPAVEDEINTRVNDEIARWVSEHPTRIVGSFTLPLQSHDASVRELERCTGELGMRVLQIPAAVNGTYLSDPSYHWVWDAVAERDLVAFMHPDGTRDLWFQQYSMWNSVGQPIEEAKFIASLIYEGVLEQRPGLKVVVAHGGGYMGHYPARMDHAYKVRPECHDFISKPPSHYMKKIYYDTMVFDDKQLEHLVNLWGADHVVIGTDYPYDMGYYEPVDFVEGTASLSREQKDQIIGGNAAKLLGLRRKR